MSGEEGWKRERKRERERVEREYNRESAFCVEWVCPLIVFKYMQTYTFVVQDLICIVCYLQLGQLVMI